MTDVTDATFEAAVLDRSDAVPVVVDLWAPWCGPCRTLGPIIEKVVDESGGAVELAKVNVDENPRIAATFQVQSIPAVFALRGRQVVDSFVGALPERAVREFVARLTPVQTEADRLAEQGDEASLAKALELQPDHPVAVLRMAELLVDQGRPRDALALLDRVPETPEVRRVAASARLADGADEGADGAAGADLDRRLSGLLERVKADEVARQEFVDLLETMGPGDPRTQEYRRALTARLY